MEKTLEFDFRERINVQNLAKGAYEAYSKRIGNFRHEQIPEFAVLPEISKEAWADAALAAFVVGMDFSKKVIEDLEKQV